MPLPPASVRIANTRRTSVASTPSAAAMPPATPATTRSSLLRATLGSGRRAPSQRPVPASPDTSRWVIAAGSLGQPLHAEITQPHPCVEHQPGPGAREPGVHDVAANVHAVVLPAE